jgi:hypothetical protein
MPQCHPKAPSSRAGPSPVFGSQLQVRNPDWVRAKRAVASNELGESGAVPPEWEKPGWSNISTVRSAAMRSISIGSQSSIVPRKRLNSSSGTPPAGPIKRKSMLEPSMSLVRVG